VKEATARLIQKNGKIKICYLDLFNFRTEEQFYPYYVQQLAHLAWIRTEKNANNAVINDTIDDLLTQNSPLFIKDVEGLSNSQIQFIKVLIDGDVEALYSKDVINKYNLGTTGNVSKIIEALIKKQVIHKIGSLYELIDPAFKLWFRNKYLKYE
jgi:hypothetical protein